MLILRRKAGESLLIGDDVKVTVLDVFEGGVRMAIDAPKEIPILRAELVKAADANRDSANIAQDDAKELQKLLAGMKNDGKK